MKKKIVSINYLRNARINKDRTLRIEVTGTVSDNERHFLDGISIFSACAMSKNDEAHTAYVADQMINLIHNLKARIKRRGK